MGNHYELPCQIVELDEEYTQKDLLKFIEDGCKKLVPNAVQYPSFFGVDDSLRMYMVDLSDVFRCRDNQFIIAAMKAFIHANNITLCGLAIENTRSLSIIIQDLDSAVHYIYPIKVYKNGLRSMGKRKLLTKQEPLWKFYSKGATH